MRVLITGINGFVGNYLARYILEYEPGVKIFGTVRRRSSLDSIEDIKSKLGLFECDMRDAHSVHNVISEVKPDKIFHLAAQSFVPTSWKIPSETFESNVIGTINLLEAVRQQHNYNPIIQIAGSSEEYGQVNQGELPIKESNELRPLSPYAVSKVAQDMLGYQYYKSYGMLIIRTRAFNHSGAGRPADFVDSGFAKQIALIEKRRQRYLLHGNLEAIRDFTHVKDIVHAYWMATETKSLYGHAVNICSGVGVKMNDMLNVLIGMSKSDIKLKPDMNKFRPSDVPVLIGDCDLFRLACGWEIKFSYEDALKDMLNYWRERV